MKFLNRSLCICLIISLFILNLAGTVLADDSQSEDTYKKTEITTKQALINESDSLINAVIGHPLRGIKRAEFISDIVDILNSKPLENSKGSFKDVQENSEYAGYIYKAVELGLIEKSEAFRPDDNITFDEALTVIVKMLGYGDYAKLTGGYPTGYRKAADYAGILKKVEVSTGELGIDNEKILILNALNARLLEFDGNYKQAVSEDTFLMRYYDIESIQGILVSSQINLYSKDIDKETSKIVIGNIALNTENTEDYNRLIGYDVIAYYDNDQNAVSVTVSEENTVVSFDAEDTSFTSGGILQYNPESKTYRSKLDGEYIVLYNGIFTDRGINALLEDAWGGFELIDNDDDDEFEVVNFKQAGYINVKSISRDHTVVFDINSDENKLDFADESGIYNIYDQEAEIRFLDIEQGDIFQVYASEDGKYITAFKLSDTVSGMIERMSEDGIYIDGVLYKTTPYFEKYYLDTASPGTHGSFAVSDDNRIVCVNEDPTKMQYGYLVRVLNDIDRNENPLLRIFTEDGKFIKCYLSDKVKIDGLTVKQQDSYYVLSSHIDELIRFRLDTEGNIKVIDTAETNEGYIAQDKPEEDSLSECVFNTNSFYYKSSVNIMYPSFNVAATKVFVIPTDSSETEEYRVRTNSYFLDGHTYGGLLVYDVDESGNAGAVVIKADTTVPSIPERAVSLVVEKVNMVYNKDTDEIMPMVYGWQDNSYAAYYIDNSISLYKASGEKLGFGDVIRYALEGDVIKNMIIDFDANENVFARNQSADSATFNTGDMGVNYQFGRAYAVENQWIYMTDSDENAFDLKALRNFPVKTNYIAIVDLKERTVTTGSLGDIRTYKNNGTADVVLLRQRALETNACIVYAQ